MLVFLLTLGTLSFATTCSAPLNEGGLGSAPVTKLGVAARLGALLRRVTGDAPRAASGLQDLGEAPEHALSSAAVLPLKARALQLKAMIEGEDSEGARALGPAVAIVRNMVQSILDSTKHDTAAASALEAGLKGEISLDSPLWDTPSAFTNQTCYLNPDESEVCLYGGALCWDGEGPVVVTPDPMLERFDDLIHSCMDVRFQEPTSVPSTGCVRGNTPNIGFEGHMPSEGGGS